MADPVKVRLCFHDRCFDGAASSAVFYRFFRERIHPGAEFHFSGMTHQARHPFPESLFDGDENAIVDFKYSSSPRVTWWFDHHQSAFLTPADAENFRQDRSGHKFYDPDYKSCTKLLADVTSAKFGFDVKPLAELIHWGDIIDGAQYPTPESAVALAEPATQLALVIEAAPEEGLVAKIIPELSALPLAEMIKLPIVAKHLGPLLEQHHRSIDIAAAAHRSPRRRDLFRHHRPGHRRLQQIYSLHAVPAGALYGERARFADARENFDRLESLESRRRGR